VLAKIFPDFTLIFFLCVCVTCVIFVNDLLFKIFAQNFLSENAVISGLRL